jgi:hypothetical protein
MSDEKSKTEPKAEEKPKPAAKAPPGSAGESSDPAVHQLLADRQTAESNGDEKAVEDIDKALGELGVTI